MDLPVIACTLDGPGYAGRVDEWRAVLSRAGHRDAVDGGVTLRFPPHPALAAELARLAAAEQACCGFFDITVRLWHGGSELTVRAPEAARDLLEEVFGAPAAAAG